ncbi:hypothetical protein [Bradyrhizobium stylosanthis]|uniref:Uncharacterized protein n=1 Tax=Bradyrhizobium stylosanthis TaxID=1803665 RepID=A0A560CX20_9BRAD|nr:hypothetical protein [Bradyrhizobium stylosanthis]TWA89408.1 hypothetical protein FBZ96_12022 [Bradyrhizobium stylosanthis]
MPIIGMSMIGQQVLVLRVLVMLPVPMMMILMPIVLLVLLLPVGMIIMVHAAG